jgi:hypothetical protein
MNFLTANDNHDTHDQREAALDAKLARIRTLEIHRSAVAEELADELEALREEHHAMLNARDEANRALCEELAHLHSRQCFGLRAELNRLDRELAGLRGSL